MTSLLHKLLAWRAALGEKAKSHLDPFQAAQDNQLNKAGKIDLAERAVFLDHLKEIAHDDVDSVRRWKKANMKGFEDVKGKGGDDDTGNIIVCDDYHNNDPPRPVSSKGSSWPLALGLTVAGSLIGGGIAAKPVLDYLKTPAVVQQPQQQTPGNTTIEKKSGFILDLPDGK